MLFGIGERSRNRPKIPEKHNRNPSVNAMEKDKHPSLFLSKLLETKPTHVHVPGLNVLMYQCDTSHSLNC